ncbi:MAG: hypothetical protein WD426_06540 [Anditalea sp.]
MNTATPERVLKILVEEGDTVRSGDVLARYKELVQDKAVSERETEQARIQAEMSDTDIKVCNSSTNR